MTEPVTTPAAVASVARLIARAGLVEAFGHVSARDGGTLLITSTDPLGSATPEQILRLPIAAGEEPGEVERVPLEWPLHAATYRARSDVGAVCRTHSPAAVALGVRGEAPPLLHGLGGLAGEVVTADRFDLVTSEAAADPLAAALGSADCLLVRGNGAVATGPDLKTAAVRAWFLEERCRVALDVGAGTVGRGQAEADERARWHEAELARAWHWLQQRFGVSEEA